MDRIETPLEACVRRLLMTPDLNVQDGHMTHQDGHDREMAKWAHQRLDAARRRGEEEQRRNLSDPTNRPAAQPDNS